MGLRGHRISLVCVPTGAGKSTIATLAPYVLNSERTLIIAPSPIICEQLNHDIIGSPDFRQFMGRGVGPEFDPEGELDPEDLPSLLRRGLVERRDWRKFAVPNGCAPSRREVHAMLGDRTYPLVVANVNRLTFRDGEAGGAGARVALDELASDLFDLVIVDEAHHYPARMWRAVCDHFANRVLFLTATKEHRFGYILGRAIGRPDNENPPAYELTLDAAVERGIVRRPVLQEFTDDDVGGQETELTVLVRRVREKLHEHDQRHPEVNHKAMILSSTRVQADQVAEAYNDQAAAPDGECAVYYGRIPNPRDTLRRFKDDAAPRVLSVCGSLIEGFDHKPVSVLGIFRNVGLEATVLYTQFVGRAVRRARNEPPGLEAAIIAHEKRNQRVNHERLMQVNEQDDDV